MSNSETRLILRDWVLGRLGDPYISGAKGELVEMPDGTQRPAWDCSGFYAGMVRQGGGPDWRKSHWTRRLFAELPETDEPLPLDAAFFGLVVDGQLTNGHVMLVWDDGRLVGACGGNAHTITVQAALKANARVQFRSGIKYRSDFVGYRRSPFL